MTESSAPKSAPAGTESAAAGIPFYEKQRQHLKELIAKRRMLEKRLQQNEEDIFQKETDYLENTPNGNIITGFDNYTKGTGAGAARRPKMGLTDQNRVFSKSSISYNPNAEAQTPVSLGSTPGSHAPTPISTSFANNKDGPSGAPTPTSTTASKAPGKKTKKAAAAGAEDSETDSKESGKKVRTAFGAVRK